MSACLTLSPPPSPRARRTAGLLCGLFGIILATCSPLRDAAAGEFAVTPTAITLNARQHSALLKLTNRGDKPLRFQVEVSSWAQDEQGSMTLTPSSKLVVYPSVFTVGPGESRSLRVGAADDAVSTESSYRLVVAELPPLTDENLVGVQMVTHMSFPVFIEPARVTRDGDIASAQLSPGHLDVRVANRGNVHAKVSSVEVIGRDASGQSVYSQSARGWYVLPGSDLVVDLDVPTDPCPAIQSLDIRAVADHATWSRTVPVSGVACGR